LRIALFQPRYFVILLPFLTVFIAVGFETFVQILSLVTKSKYYKKLLPYFCLGLFFLITIPTSFLAIQASHHTVIEEVGQFVRDQNKDAQWVTTNYWPSAFVDNVGYKITWYTSLLTDSESLSGGGKTKYTKMDKPSFDILNKEGGWIIVEDLYSQTFSQGPERKAILDSLKGTFRPVKLFEDKSPNWPFYDKASNLISVYHLKSKLSNEN
jgi:hypothetical protein